MHHANHKASCVLSMSGLAIFDQSCPAQSYLPGLIGPVLSWCLLVTCGRVHPGWLPWRVQVSAVLCCQRG
jgi:hypothetical protein